jgi:hypothetical protein
LDLLEGAGEFGGDGKAVIRNRAKHRTLLLQIR